MQENNIICQDWNGMPIVKVSSVGGDFAEWLYGQTMPFVEEDENPTDWAYLWDYNRWKAGLPVID